MKNLLMVTFLLGTSNLFAGTGSSSDLVLNCYNLTQEIAESLAADPNASIKDEVESFKHTFVGTISFDGDLATVEMKKGAEVGDIENGTYVSDGPDSFASTEIVIRSNESAYLLWLDEIEEASCRSVGSARSESRYFNFVYR